VSSLLAGGEGDDWNVEDPGSPHRKAGAMRAPSSSYRQTCKPDSVEDGHSSGRRIAANARGSLRRECLLRPTRNFRPVTAFVFTGRLTEAAAPGRRVPALLPDSFPIWSCSVWGLPCLRRYRRSGALLPHLFTLTLNLSRDAGGIFSVALAVPEP